MDQSLPDSQKSCMLYPHRSNHFVWSGFSLNANRLRVTRHWWFLRFQRFVERLDESRPWIRLLAVSEIGFAAGNQACCHLGRQFDQFLGKLHLPFSFVRTTNPASLIPWFGR
jgi:hypothetical protein